MTCNLEAKASNLEAIFCSPTLATASKSCSLYSPLLGGKTLTNRHLKYRSVFSLSC